MAGLRHPAATSLGAMSPYVTTPPSSVDQAVVHVMIEPTPTRRRLGSTPNVQTSPMVEGRVRRRESGRGRRPSVETHSAERGAPDEGACRTQASPRRSRWGNRARAAVDRGAGRAACRGWRSARTRRRARARRARGGRASRLPAPPRVAAAGHERDRRGEARRDHGLLRAELAALRQATPGRPPPPSSSPAGSSPPSARRDVRDRPPRPRRRRSGAREPARTVTILRG